jgi:predicted kinase
MPNNLIMTVGLPRCGKSTWAKSQIEKGIPVVNPDSIRLSLHGQPFVESAEPFVWAIAKVMVASLFGAGHNTVILDATNLTIERRKIWIDKRWECSYRLFRDVSKEECIRRAIETNQEYLVDVINKMAETAEWPEEAS